VIGTGALITVKPSGGGGYPIKVELINSTGLTTAVWTESMGNTGAMTKRITDGTMSLVTGANGITPVFGGFTLGADADLNVSGEKIHWELTF